MSKQYNREEVKKHNTPDDLWVILDNSVYDLTKFIHEHPGGEEVLLDRAGGDGTDCFDAVGHTSDAKERRELYKIGEIVENERTTKDIPTVIPEKPGPKEHSDLLGDYIIPAGIIIIATYIYFFF